MALIEIELAQSALNDLAEIQAWYIEQGAPTVGDKLVRKVLKRISVLASHPELGRIVPEFEQPFLRELIEPPFRVVYRANSNRVSIVRVWRSERLLDLT
ncbi:MAG TPA: type II toxin-antitoxin system RelE/ParE family toxin [Gammaproteobacteria bacterium]|nr:type II toxin-antitoxin system RelE/ParE family toxin [Gammaproteobacteria bacterium]